MDAKAYGHSFIIQNVFISIRYELLKHSNASSYTEKLVDNK